MKRTIIISGMLMIFFLVFLTIPASAQTLKIGSAVGSQGDSVNIPIIFMNTADSVCAIEFEIIYDSTLLNLTEITQGRAFQDFEFGVNEYEKGRVSFLVFSISLTPLPSSELARLKLNTTETFAATEITIENLTMSDQDGTESTPASLTNGSITNPYLPTAHAGEDHTVYEGDDVILDGSASVNPASGELTYLWKQTAGTPVTLSNAASPNPAFTAPEVGVAGDKLVFDLTIKNAPGFERTDSVVITVADISPVITLNPPQYFASETAGTTSFEITNTGTGIMNWQAQTHTDWLSIQSDSGTESGTIVVDYTQNPGETRVGTIKITDPEAANSPQIFQVIQSPAAWLKTETSTVNHLRGIWGSSSSHVFAVGENGTLLRYDGSAWTAMTGNTSAYLRAIWGSSETNVFAVGYFGTILHYDGNDTGTWTPMNSGTFNHLKAVWGSDENNVFAVGDEGTILHYDGDVWTKMPIATINPLYAVWGSSAGNVFAAGGNWDSFTMLHYDGSVWKAMDGISNIPYGIWGSAAGNVFAVGNGGTISRYTGDQWREMESNTSDYLRAVWGTSGSNIYAVGVGGMILHYDGVKWARMPNTVSEDFFGIWGSSETDIFIAGNFGTILHYAPSTLSVTPAYRNVLATSGIVEFEVKSAGSDPMEWWAVSDVPWVSIDSVSSGTDNGTFTVSYDTNAGGSRTGTVTITAPGSIGSPQKVEIRQGVTGKGDVDGNGVVDMADAILALKVLAGMNPEGVHIYADVNRDKQIGVEEVIYILRMAVGS